MRIRARTADPETFPPVPAAVGELEASTVLRMEVAGFESFALATARQCVTGDQERCGNPLEVQAGEEGTASFQYLVTDDFVREAGGCRAAGRRCSVVVEERPDRDVSAEVRTVFHDDVPPPGVVRVTPNTGITEGQAVVVEVEHLPPGARVRAMLCAAPDVTGPERCGRPGPLSVETVGPGDTARTTLTLRSGPVGRNGAPCGRGHACGVAVASDTVFVDAPVVPITFAGPPGARYHPARLAGALAAAVIMLGLAAWLVRRSDWSPIGEEAAPEIDDVDYADLDAIVAALPPEDTEAELTASGRH